MAKGKSKFAVAVVITFALAACEHKPHALDLTTVYTVDQFAGDLVLRQRVMAACDANPGELKDDPNCVNSKSAHFGAAREEDHVMDVRKVAAAQDIAVISTALKLYRLDTGAYPSQPQGLAALIKLPSNPEPKNWKEGGYLTQLPNDPWGRPYIYLNPGVHGDVDIYSVGAGGPDWVNEKWSAVGSWQKEAQEQGEKYLAQLSAQPEAK